MALTEAQELELLALLELERLDREALPVDTRRPIADFLADALTDCAERSADPVAYLSLSQAFAERRDFHLAALLPAAGPSPDDTATYLGEFLAAWHEAERLTLADGFADPALTLAAPTALVAEAPTSVLDVERIPAAARRARPRVPPDYDAEPSPPRPSPVVDAVVERDVLGPFRGRPNYDGPIFPDN